MRQDREEELEGLAEEMADDLGPGRRNNHPTPGGLPFQSLPRMNALLLAGACVVIVFIIVALMFRGEGGVSSEDLAAVRAGLDRIEKDLKKAEALNKRLAGLEDKQAGLEKALSRSAGNFKDISRQIHRLERKVTGLEKKIVSVASPPVPAQAPQKVTAPPVKGHYHVVQKKQTLYQIAQKYGMTLQELCRVNNITKDHVIQPGQRLLVVPKK